jgi:hypothetical protein
MQPAPDLIAHLSTDERDALYRLAASSSSVRRRRSQCPGLQAAPECTESISEQAVLSALGEILQ